MDLILMTNIHSKIALSAVNLMKIGKGFVTQLAFATGQALLFFIRMEA